MFTASNTITRVNSSFNPPPTKTSLFLPRNVISPKTLHMNMSKDTSVQVEEVCAGELNDDAKAVDVENNATKPKRDVEKDKWSHLSRLKKAGLNEIERILKKSVFIKDVDSTDESQNIPIKVMKIQEADH